MKKRLFIFMVLFIVVGLLSAYQSKAEELAIKLKGRILLQVESKGEAWYINPKDSKRYYMANGAAAFAIMRDLGVGVTNANLTKIKSDKAYAKKQQGKIFLQIESHGEAYYIDVNGVAHYLKDGPAAYGVMRQLGLGIKTADLAKINLADKDKATSTIPAAYVVKISTSSACAYSTGMSGSGIQTTNVRAIIEGTAQGPVGARVELPILIWSDDKWNCGDWTLTSGALIAVGSTCTRKEGQPETTTWKVDTGGEEQGDFLRGKSRSYSAKIYKKGGIYSEKEDKISYICQ